MLTLAHPSGHKRTHITQIISYDGAALWVVPRVKHAALIAGDGLRTPSRLAVVVRAGSGLGPSSSSSSSTGGGGKRHMERFEVSTCAVLPRTNMVCMVCVWSVYGLCMVCVWSVYGLCMVCVWSMYGLCMVCEWSVNGLCMVCVWSVYGLCMVYVYGLCMVCIWSVYGLCAA